MARRQGSDVGARFRARRPHSLPETQHGLDSQAWWPGFQLQIHPYTCVLLFWGPPFPIYSMGQTEYRGSPCEDLSKNHP